MRLQAREIGRENWHDYVSISLRNRATFQPVRFRPIVRFNHHNAGRRNKRKQSLELARPGRAESQHRQDYDGMRPLKLRRVAWVDEAHGIAALLRGAVNEGRATSQCTLILQP